MSWPKLSAISAVSQKAQLYFMLRAGSIRSAQVVTFLRHLLRHVAGPIVLVWDRAPIHRSAMVRNFAQQHPRLHIILLPAYAPELNPDEGVWRHLKRIYLANFCPDHVHQLKTEIRRSTIRLRARPKLIQSFFKHAKLFF
jgi:putative transposase